MLWERQESSASHLEEEGLALLGWEISGDLGIGPGKGKWGGCSAGM